MEKLSDEILTTIAEKGDYPKSYRLLLCPQIAAELLSTRQKLEQAGLELSALREQVRWIPDDYDPGLLNDWGGGNVNWWWDYIRTEVNRCNGFWREQYENSLPPLPGGVE